MGVVARVWGRQCCLGSQSVLWPQDDFLVWRAVSSSVPSPHCCSTVGFSGSCPLQGPGGTCVTMQVSDAQSLGSALLQMVLGYSIFGATERWHEERPFSKAATAQICKWLKAQERKCLQPCWEPLSQETPSSPGCGTGWQMAGYFTSFWAVLPPQRRVLSTSACLPCSDTYCWKYQEKHGQQLELPGFSFLRVYGIPQVGQRSSNGVKSDLKKE